MVALAEQHLAGRELASLRWTLGRSGTRREVDDGVGQWHQAVVVGGDDDEPTRIGEVTQQTDDALDLQVVEVGGRFVGEQHRWIVGETTLMATRCC